METCANCGKEFPELWKDSPLCESCYKTCPLGDDEREELFMVFRMMQSMTKNFSVHGTPKGKVI